MAWITRLLDRLVFTTIAVAGLQIPGLLNAYLQRLGGHLDEARLQLAQWQQLAQQHYAGDIDAMIASYQSSLDPAIRASGELVFTLAQRVEQLQSALLGLQDKPLWEQMGRLPLHLDLQIAGASWQNYQWTVPLDLTAIGLAALVALIITGTLKGVLRALAHLISSPFGKKTAVSSPAYR